VTEREDDQEVGLDQYVPPCHHFSLN
jgi:hypothetical protein